MKNSYLLFIGFILIFSACKSNNKTEVIAEKTKMYAFSDSVKTDTFKISLIGEKTEDMSFVFTISNYKGEQIYKEEFKAEQLLNNFLASEDLKKESDKIAFLNQRMNMFFDEEHFLEPAVTAEQQPDNNAPDEAFYDELKQTHLNGFYYSLGKTKSIYIAWSINDQKVKVYYQCC